MNKKRALFTILLIPTIGALALFAFTRAELALLYDARLSVGEFPGIERTAAHLVSLPGAEAQVVEFNDGKGGIRKRPGRISTGNIVLQYPVKDVPEGITSWFESFAAEPGPGQRSDAVLTIEDLNDPRGGQVSWQLTNAFPTRITHAKITRVGFRGQVVTEVEIAFDDITSGDDER